MREAFNEQLDALLADLAAMARAVHHAVAQASRSLLTGDLALAEQVVSADAEINQARNRVEDSTLGMLGLQAPVAGDLRFVVAALKMSTELERMGDLSVHVAKIARLRTPNLAVAEPARATIDRMAQVAETMVGRAADVIEQRDADGAASLHADEEEMDRLRRESFRELLGGDWSAGVEAAIDVALLGRYYERIADHALSVANRVVFIVTGDVPEAPAQA